MGTSIQNHTRNIGRLLQQASLDDKRTAGKNSTLMRKATDDIERIMNQGTALEKAAVIIKSVFTLGLYFIFSRRASKDEQNTLLRNSGDIVSALCKLKEKAENEQVTFTCDSQQFYLGKNGDDNQVTLRNPDNGQDIKIKCDIETALQSIREELQNKDLSRDYRDQLAVAITHAATGGVEHNVINTAREIVSSNNKNDMMRMSDVLKKITAEKGNPVQLEPVNINKIMFDFTVRNPTLFTKFLEKQQLQVDKFFENGILVPSQIEGNFGIVQTFFIHEMLEYPDGRKTVESARLALQEMNSRAGDLDLSVTQNSFAVQAGSLYFLVDSLYA